MGLHGRSYDVDVSRFIYALRLRRIELDGLLLNEPYFKKNSLLIKSLFYHS